MDDTYDPLLSIPLSRVPEGLDRTRSALDAYLADVESVATER